MDETDETMTELTSRQCWDLLASTDVGRLAVNVDGTPDIFPVNYVVANGTVVFRTAPGRKHVPIRRADHVALEIDHVDRESGLAWSVVAKGRARDVSSEPELSYVRGLPLRPMHGSAKAIFVRLEPDLVTGRSFVTASPQRWEGPDGLASAR